MIITHCCYQRCLGIFLILFTDFKMKKFHEMFMWSLYTLRLVLLEVPIILRHRFGGHITVYTTLRLEEFDKIIATYFMNMQLNHSSLFQRASVLVQGEKGGGGRTLLLFVGLNFANMYNYSIFLKLRARKVCFFHGWKDHFAVVIMFDVVSCSQTILTESVGGGVWKYFSATCWFYGQNIFKFLQYPIGK